jgi:DNA-binding NarL/FixJ family response regulator
MAAAPTGASAQSAPVRRKTRVLVVDEDGIMRDGLCALLQSDDALEVVAATASRREAVQNLTTAQPDVIIIDFAADLIASGKSYISPSALDRMVTAYAKTSDRPGRTRGSGALTSREQEVITLIAKGYRTREMAELMSLSHKTVEKHRTNLMRKLGLRSAAAVAAYAITHGFA